MIVVERSKYKLAIYEDKKEVHVQILGFVKEEIVPEYIADLDQTLSKVPKSFTFVVDARKQSPLPAKVASDLGNTMMFYPTLGLKQVYIVHPESKIAYVQVRNALESVDFPGKYVPSLSDVK